MKVISTALAITALSIASPALCATVPDKMKVLVEVLDQESSACGLTETSLRSAVSAALRYNRIIENPDSSVMVYLRTTSLHFSSIRMCAHSWEVRIMTFGPSKPLGMQEAIAARITLGEASGIISRIPHNNSDLYAAIKDGVDKAISDITLVTVL